MQVIYAHVVIGWSIRKFNSVLTVFLWGMLFRMVFGESDWIAILTTSFSWRSPYGDEVNFKA